MLSKVRKEILDVVNEDNSTLLCFLLVGKMERLARYSLESVLGQYSGAIAIGYINESDTEWVPKQSNIRFIKIEQAVTLNISEYMNFSSPNFYKIVINKWDLLLLASNLGFKYVVYCDLDVIWLNNPIPGLENMFAEYSSVHLLIQSFTRDSQLPCLCMGFLAMRVNDQTKQALSQCKASHENSHNSGDLIGDDEIISNYFRSEGYPSWIRELPQSTFPTGNLYPLFLRHFRFPFMESINPYIFHLNFVVGMRNKEILLWYLKLFGKLKIQGPSNFWILSTVSKILLKRLTFAHRNGKH